MPFSAPLHRYWFTFDVHIGLGSRGLMPVLGCGVTARDLADAIALIQEHVCRGAPLPDLLSVVEDVELTDLDAGHVLPNIGFPEFRGVWFPAIPLPGVPTPT